MKNGATHYRKPKNSSEYELLKSSGGIWFAWVENDICDFEKELIERYHWVEISVNESEVFKLITKSEYEQQLTKWFNQNLFGDMVDFAFLSENDFENFEHQAVVNGISDYSFNPLSSIDDNNLRINATNISVKLKNGKIIEFGSSEFGWIIVKNDES